MALPHKIADFEVPRSSKFDAHPALRGSGIHNPSALHNPLASGADPTEDLRNLIEELQAAARSARAELRVVEVERDDLALQLEESLVRVDRLRANERELRSKFVEVTTLIRERDTAQADLKRITEATRGAEEQIASLTQSRNDALRQRDEALRRTDALKRSADEHATQAAEALKQVLAVRQARDAAHAQNLEVGTKLSRAEDRIAELEYDCEAAQKAAQKVADELTEIRRQLDSAIADRDTSTAQVARLTEDLDAQRRKLLDLSEQKDAAANSAHAAALGEARTQMEQLTREREAAQARAVELGRELETLRQQFQTSREEQQKAASVELQAANEKAAALEAQARELRHESANLRQRLGALEQEAANPAALAAAQEALAKARTESETACASLEESQRRITDLTAELEAVRAQTGASAAAMEEELTTLRARVAAVASLEAEASARAAEAREIAARFERQRVETIDIAAQLQSAHREIRELSANLAEARLQVKFAQAATLAAKGSGARVKAMVTTLHEPTGSEPVPAPRPIPLELGITQPLEPREIKSALTAMRQCYQAFAKCNDDLSLLNELYCHVHAFAERTRDSGLLAAHRLTAAFAEFTHGLYQNPVQVNASTLRSVSQTIDFLGSLMRDDALAAMKDPAMSRIYAVDDDPDNCESIKLAMETAAMRTTCALDPIEALAELTELPVDLIFVDVNMPGMDGFELCSQLRQLPQHAATPIVFLSGLATVENRTQSAVSGGTDFIAKPFNLYELTVKALTHILRAQMQIKE
jgi:CheY-like chemotaxis protein/DNA repair exonuclease SbcCD ATPase subunit